MKTLRRILLLCAFLSAGLLTGCDDEEQGTLPFLGGAWSPVVTPGASSFSVSGSGTP